jgi:hypothetical protein
MFFIAPLLFGHGSDIPWYQGERSGLFQHDLNQAVMVNKMLKTDADQTIFLRHLQQFMIE